MDTHQQWAQLLRAISAPRQDSVSDALLRQAVQLGHDVAPDAVGCSVTTLEGDGYHTPISSNRLALDLDRAQYEAGDGPCMAAARTRHHEHFDATTDHHRFPGFTEAAVEHGVSSPLSLPVTGWQVPAALNLYASSRHAFDGERPQAVAALLARCVSALMAPPEEARRTVDAAVSAGEVEAARARARLIADAESALMARRSVSRTDALGMLIQRSRTEVRSIFDVAREVAAGEVEAAR